VDKLEELGARASLYRANLLAFTGVPRQFEAPTEGQIEFMQLVYTRERKVS